MRNKKKEAGKKQRDDFWIVLSASAGVVFISVAIVMVVRAYLTAQTDSATNPFAPMTYTNTDVYEPTSSFTVNETTNTFTKAIQVYNNEGDDKKPVYARVALVATVYDANGLNVTSDYPTITVTPPESYSDDWAKGTDGYYYYKYILHPGDYSTALFGADQKFTIGGITGSASLPENGRVDIAVVLDTVQAIESDSALWKDSPSYTTSFASNAWGAGADSLTTTRKYASAVTVNTGS